MKIVTIIVRVLMGLLLTYAALAYFFPALQMGGEHDPPTEPMKAYMGGLATVHLLDIVKGIELLVGLLLLIGRYVTFANIVIFPISLNIVLFHALLGPSDIGTGIFLLVCNLFLFYRYWNNYKTLLTP